MSGISGHDASSLISSGTAHDCVLLQLTWGHFLMGYFGGRGGLLFVFVVEFERNHMSEYGLKLVLFDVLIFVWNMVICLVVKQVKVLI